MLFHVLRILLIGAFSIGAYFATYPSGEGAAGWLPIFFGLTALGLGVAGSFLPNLLRSTLTIPEAFGVAIGLCLGLISSAVLVYIGVHAGEQFKSIGIGIGICLGSFITLYAVLAGVRYMGTGYFSGFGGMPGEEESHMGAATSKVLDTSVIIDGRILDIVETHFIDGPLIIPNFVLREIQLISDSPDPIKRSRGRRGLDMLNKLRGKSNIEVKITYKDFTETREVDAKLVKICLEKDFKLITNDFNLHKVAELQGVKVLNLNNLANALKPVVLPGEEIIIQVMKEGKDDNQGIGYLEDGTMVVVENGRHLLGKDVRVNVTSIIQTAAGKMIFTKARDGQGGDKGGGGRGRGDRRGRKGGGGNRGGSGSSGSGSSGGNDRQGSQNNGGGRN